MKIEYVNGGYLGTLKRHNGSSLIYGTDRMGVVMSLIESEFEAVDRQPRFREEEEAWTDDDWERDFRRDEIIGQHKDDDNV
jgi:hypothetical protein